MVRYAFRVGKSGRYLPQAENISSMAVADRDACEPFSPPSPKLTHADGDSIIADLLADDVIRWADICHPASGEPPDTMFRWRSLSAWRVLLSCLKTFQGD
jgi:hypothetical protein